MINLIISVAADPGSLLARPSDARPSESRKEENDGFPGASYLHSFLAFGPSRIFSPCQIVGRIIQRSLDPDIID